ncbi:MAG: hypothetical protein CL424_08200 [Acidimicrobiaceae bacterium]|nr:hypothetical protein [Acidimicrobiaceae bacterium]
MSTHDIAVERTHMATADSSSIDPQPSNDARASTLPVTARLAAIGLCCGVPLLGSLGVAGLVAGVATARWTVVAAASLVVMVVVGVPGCRRQACRNDAAVTGTWPVPRVGAVTSVSSREAVR